jgi:hypothetical protein
MRILSNCKYAIFEISVSNGQTAEIEYARANGINTLLIMSATDEEGKKKPTTSEMLRTIGFPIESFCYLNELGDIFKKYFPEVPE